MDDVLEIWRYVSGYNHRYMVSDRGRVRSLDRIGLDSRGRQRYRPGEIMTQRIVNGYYKVTFTENKISKEYKISRLMAIAFLNNPENKEDVDHIDGNPLNNNIENLRWCTTSENLRNSKTRTIGASKYRGVSKFGYNGRWRATVSMNNAHIHLGTFKTEIEAADRYDVFVLENYGEFGRLNFPEKHMPI